MSCGQRDRVFLHALRALPPSEAREVQAHVDACDTCRRDLAALREVVGTFVAWPTNVLRPSAALWDRLAARIAADLPAGAEKPKTDARPYAWVEPPWEVVAPGISVKLLANDTEKHVVSMLVRLEPGTDYPPHSHAGIEELHLLDGELWIDDRKLFPGDYNRAEPGTSDARVWSETGCTCVLVTSTRDVLR